MAHAEVLGLHINLLANLEVGCRKSSVVGRLLIALLRFGNVGFESVMKFSQVDSKLPSAGGSQITLRVNCQIRMVPLIGKEGGRTSCLVRCIVVGKFRKQKK